MSPEAITYVLQRAAIVALAAVLAVGTACAQAPGEDRLPISLTKVPFAPHARVGFHVERDLTGVEASDAALLERLRSAGFENARLRTTRDTLYVSYEYRMARGSHAGACAALGVIGGPFDHVVAVLEHQEVPMTALSFVGPAPLPMIDQVASRGPSVVDRATAYGPCAGYAITGATQHVRPYVNILKSGLHARDRFIDVSFHPRYSALFGFYRDPVMLQLNLAPRLNVRLWKGFEIGAQIIIPFHNEFSSEGDYVRPGLLTLSQFLRLPGPLFLRASAGTFTNRRFGLDVRARRLFSDGRYWTGFQVGRTGHLFYPNGSIFVERDAEWLALATAGIAWRRHNLYLDGAAGRFLFGDLGGRLEIMRQFEMIDIGFVFTQTVNGANAGLRLILPLLEGTFVGSRNVRVRPAPDFTWDYMYRAGVNSGESYETGYYMDRVYRQHQPDFLMDLLTTP